MFGADLRDVSMPTSGGSIPSDWLDILLALMYCMRMVSALRTSMLKRCMQVVVGGQRRVIVMVSRLAAFALGCRGCV